MDGLTKEQALSLRITELLAKAISDAGDIGEGLSGAMTSMSIAAASLIAQHSDSTDEAKMVATVQLAEVCRYIDGYFEMKVERGMMN